jgi:branched-chain amino acid transport system permease protein
VSSLLGSALARVATRAGLLAALLAFAIVLPTLVSHFHTEQLTYVGIYFIALVGLNILTGYSGQISLGHGAFMGIGAYTTAVIVSHEAVSNLWTIPMAGIVAGVVGYLFGYPALRLAGVYLALATFAIAIAMPSLTKRFPGLTGGGTGINLDQPRTPFGLPINHGYWLYYLTWGVGGVLFVTAWLLLRGRLGRSLRALRDNDVAASCLGVDLAAYKRLAFGLSAFYAGIAGSLFAIVVAYVNPDTFPISLSILLLSGAVVGGLGSLAGPLLGALFVEFVPIYSNHLSKDAPSVVYGLILIGVMFLMPYGAAGLLGRVAGWLPRLLARGRPLAAANPAAPVK